MSELTTPDSSALVPTDPPPPPRPDARQRVLALLLPLRLFLAAGWLRAAVEKIIDADWWTGAELDAFLIEQRPHMIDFFPSVVDAVIAPWSLPIAWLVVEIQLAIGLALLLGRHVRLALWAAIGLNTTFVLAGAVNPSAFYLVMQLVLVLALAEPVPWRRSVATAAGWLVVAAVFVPFIGTLDPALVIDDPASMLAFSAALMAIGTLAAGEWWRVPAFANSLVPRHRTT